MREFGVLAGGARAVGDLALEGARIGAEVVSRLRPRTSHTCGCEIPPPCWTPISLGSVRSPVCPGGKAVVRLRVTNCGFTPQAVHVSANDTAVSVDPASLTFGPLDQATFILTRELPATAARDDRHPILVAVRGSRDYFFRWTVESSGRNARCSSDLAVDDCPDLIHHWYDHFYCERPRRNQR
jgi:hypothetical protein